MEGEVVGGKILDLLDRPWVERILKKLFSRGYRKGSVIPRRKLIEMFMDMGYAYSTARYYISELVLMKVLKKVGKRHYVLLLDSMPEIIRLCYSNPSKKDIEEHIDFIFSCSFDTRLPKEWLSRLAEFVLQKYSRCKL